MGYADLRRRVERVSERLDPDAAHREAYDALVDWLGGEDEPALFARVLARGGADRLSGLIAWISEGPTTGSPQISETT